MKALLNWRYYVLMVVGMIAVIGTFSVPIDDQPWKIQCKMPPKTKKILPPENIQ